MLRVISLMVLLFGVTFTSGCGKPEDPFIGVWQVHEADTRASIADAIRKEKDSKGTKASEEDVKQGVDLFWNFVKQSDMRFDIRANKTFVQTVNGKPKDQGSWTLNDSTMTFTTAPDSPKKKSYNGTASGGRLRIAFDGEKGAAVVFEPAR